MSTLRGMLITAAVAAVMGPATLSAQAPVRVRIVTDSGAIEVALAPDKAPLKSNWPHPSKRHGTTLSVTMREIGDQPCADLTTILIH